MDVIPNDETPRRRGPYAKSAQRSLDIISAATAVFAEHGYHGGSLRDIARELGVSLTSVTHHFGSKYALLEAVLDHADRTGSGDFEQDCREHGVYSAVMTRVRSNLERPELLRLLAILSAESSAPGHPAHDWFVDRYTVKLASLSAAFAYDQAAGRIAQRRNPAMLSHLLTAAWDGMQLQWLINPVVDMEEAMRSFFDWAAPEASMASRDPRLGVGPRSETHSSANAGVVDVTQSRAGQCQLAVGMHPDAS